MGTDWEGLVGEMVDAKFPLHRLLGSNDRSATYLTGYESDRLHRAAIKMVSVDDSEFEEWRSRWNRTSQITHPNLVGLFQTGICEFDEAPFVYIVTELAEDNLAEVLLERPLTAEETLEMLAPTADVLGYLHGKGLAHSSLKPSNFLAVGDELKLSRDRLTRPGDPPFDRSPYDAPEIGETGATKAADVWSLGVTLVEVLTQQRLDQPGPLGEPIVPEDLPAPFLEIVRHCLVRDPERRWTVEQIAASLPGAGAPMGLAETDRIPTERRIPVPAPNALVAEQGSPQKDRERVMAASASAQGVQSYPVTAPIVGSTSGSGYLARPVTPPIARPAAPPSLAARPPHTSTEPSRSTSILKNGRTAVIVGMVLLLAAIILGPRLFPPGTEAAPPAASSTAPVAKSSSLALKASKPEAREAAPDTAPAKVAEKSGKSPEKAAAPGGSAQPPARSDAERAVNPVRAVSPSAPGDVVLEVLPDVPAKVRNTIQGKVSVGVRVRVNSSGDVVDATLNSKASSRYFAQLAIKAAKKWKFAAGTENGGAPREFVVRFQFLKATTKVVTERAS